MMKARRLLGILKTKPSIVDKDDAIPLQIRTGKVKFNNVDFGYVDGKLVLKNVSISAPRGLKVGIVGKSRAGKSTTIKLFTRFYDVNKGSMEIDGQDIRDVTLERYVIFPTWFLF
jgi:ABC-type multidrug transport system fused ATPase/permease subunit